MLQIRRQLLDDDFAKGFATTPKTFPTPLPALLKSFEHWKQQREAQTRVLRKTSQKHFPLRHPSLPFTL